MSMALFQLPERILQNIVTYAVIASGLRDGLRLRLVNRAFDVEVCNAIFGNDVLDCPQEICYEFGARVSGIVWLRFFRSFLLHRGGPDRNARKFGRQLSLAAKTLSTYSPQPYEVKDIPPNRLSPDACLGAYSGEKYTPSWENAVAMLADAVFYTDLIEYRRVFTRLARTPDCCDINEVWEFLRNKKAEYWILAVSARRNDLELSHAAIETLRSREDVPNVMRNLSAALVPAAMFERCELLSLLLDQQEVHIDFYLVPCLDVALFEGNVRTIEFFMSVSRQAYDAPTQIGLIRSAMETRGDWATRRKLLSILFSMSTHWQHVEVLTWIFHYLCGDGDFETLRFVVEAVQAVGAELQSFTWTIVWEGRSLGCLALAARAGSWEILQYLFEHREFLASHLHSEFSPQHISEGIVLAIESGRPKSVEQLLRWDLSEGTMPEILLVFASLAGTPEMVKMILDKFSLDLSQNVDNDPRFWDMFKGRKGTTHERIWRVSGAIWQLRPDMTPYLSRPNMVNLGTCCLIIALKAWNPDVVQFLLQQGVRIGRKYVECTASTRLQVRALLTEDSAVNAGKHRVWGFNWRPRTAIDEKLMLERGGHVRTRTLLFSRDSKRPSEEHVEATSSSAVHEPAVSSSAASISGVSISSVSDSIISGSTMVGSMFSFKTGMDKASQSTQTDPGMKGKTVRRLLKARPKSLSESIDKFRFKIIQPQRLNAADALVITGINIVQNPSIVMLPRFRERSYDELKEQMDFLLQKYQQPHIYVVNEQFQMV